LYRPDYATIPESKLDTLFDVKGHFYLGKTYPCREYLHIRSADKELLKVPDLLVVMMNPGESTPLIGGDNGQKEVPASPDKTQYRIMRVMLAKNLRFARVLNLSDYRDKQSHQFEAMIPTLEKNYPEHSIFHANRIRDFNHLFPASAKLVVGWGAGRRLEPLVRRALGKFQNSRLVGVKRAGDNWCYYHPSRCSGWLAKVVAQL